MLCYDNLCYVMICRDVLWYVMLGHDRLWHVMICFEIRKFMMQNSYAMISKLYYKWNDFIRVYVRILSSVLREEIMGLSCMVYYNGKYEGPHV